MKSKNNGIWTLLLVIFALLIGFAFGNFYKIFEKKIFVSSSNKIDVILDIINQNYVDSVELSNLIEEAIPSIISGLDPHSEYIPAEDLESKNEDIEGHFSGIGVQFTIQEDTVMIVSVISGGPSEKVGLSPGDRIVTINDSLFVGSSINEEKVRKTLRGEKGSHVRVGIKRNKSEEIKAYDITRGDVPVNSVDIAYEVAPGIGLIKINKFGRTTYNEFIKSIALLKQKGCTSYIIDLRGNLGGLLDSAINIINEFLSRGNLIVYTEGENSPKSSAFANGTGSCLTEPLVILMDEWSASASEIMGGAIQDNDRGIIIGRRSFGKGLVQKPFDFTDNSALRLTIARYYTPSGRCIQKDYELGKSEDYQMDIYNRYSNGEFDSADSIKFTHEETFKTSIGRPVYGGGGIMPDIFIARDTIGVTSYYNHLINDGIIYEFAFHYSDKNRILKEKYPNYQSLEKYLKSQSLLEEVVAFAEKKGIKRRPTLINISKNKIENLTYAYIIRDLFGDEGFYPILYAPDPVVKKAIQVINSGDAFPKAPQKK